MTMKTYLNTIIIMDTFMDMNIDSEYVYGHKYINSEFVDTNITFVILRLMIAYLNPILLSTCQIAYVLSVEKPSIVLVT